MQNTKFSGLFIGCNLIVLSRVDSTNNYLKKQLAKSKPLQHGTVIMAEEQYAGRGQANNRWMAEPGKNLTFSILINPDFLNIKHQFLLSQVVCLGIYDTLQTIVKKAGLSIKWPNDIYWESYKLGGVLIENIVRGQKWQHAIIGIGINVNQIKFHDVLKNVISLKKILHYDYDLKVLLTEICRNIDARYTQLKNEQYDILKQDYHNNLYQMNKKQLFVVKGEQREGYIRGVNEQGLLSVELLTGKEFFGFKEITFLTS